MQTCFLSLLLAKVKAAHESHICTKKVLLETNPGLDFFSLRQEVLFQKQPWANPGSKNWPNLIEVNNTTAV